MTDLVQSAEQTTALASLRERERQLEIEVRTTQARLEEVRDMIGLLEGGGKKRRKRADVAPAEPTPAASWRFTSEGETSGATT